MPRYFCRFFSRTLASVSKTRAAQQEEPLRGWNFNFDGGDTQVRISDALTLSEEGNVRLHTGLYLDCQLSADNLEAAELKTKNYCEHLLNLVAFSTVAATSEARFVVSYQLDVPKDNPFMAVVHRVETMWGSFRPLDEGFFEPVFLGLDRKMDSRLGLSLSWLRKALGEDNPYDEFVALWVSLEALNTELASHLEAKIAPSPVERLRALITKLPWKSKESVVSAIKKFAVKRANLKNKEFNDLYRRRSKVVHGRGQFDTSFRREIREDIPVLRRLLIRAIGEILAVPEALTVQTEAQTVRRVIRPTTYLVYGTLTFPRSVPQLSDVGLQPRVVLEKVNSKFDLDEDGKIRVRPEPTFRFHNATFSVRRIELRGDEDAGIKPSIV